MRPFPNELLQPNCNGFHAQLTLFLRLLQIIISTMMAMMMMMMMTFHSTMWTSSGTTVMKTLLALDAPRIKNILARGLQQFDQRENYSTFLKVDNKVNLIGQCSRS